MKVRFHNDYIRLRLADDDLSLLEQGVPVRSITPMLQGDTLEISLVIGQSIPEVTINMVHRDLEFRIPLCEKIEALLSREVVVHTIELQTSGGLLAISIERDLGRGMHLGDPE